MSMQYTPTFHGCKNDNFQMKIFDIFLIFAQNIDCGYMSERLSEGLYYLCNKNKGADQLRGNREADLRLCFRICKDPVFS